MHPVTGRLAGAQFRDTERDGHRLIGDQLIGFDDRS
jgi:hypothetical protein